VRHVWKEFGSQVVLENLNLEIGDHEFVTIIGASGCGKTALPAPAARRGAADTRRDSDRW
jgi:ABC-type nitrate/sulfonate/bicarbonate transport system ATPase subunit